MVRRAWDTLMERHVAIKILEPPESAPDETRRRRFLHEARITAGLAHPGIVPVHERGVLQDGRPFFVMKEVVGRTYGQVIELVHRASDAKWRDIDGWSLRRLVDALARVAEAVGYAHEQGVVHRDLKPSNVMVGAFGEVFVMDWGVARSEDVGAWDPLTEDTLSSLGPTPEGSLRTCTGAVVGTVAYMSPEQASGRVSELGPWTDVYALGLLLGELLTGHAINGHASPQKVYEDIVRGKTPRLLARPRRPPIPVDLAAVYERSVRCPTAERYPDGSAFAAALRTWLDGDARRARAAQLVASTADLRAEVAQLRSREVALRAQARRLLDELPSHASEDDKLSGWRAEDAADEMRAKVKEQELCILDVLRGALQHDPEHIEAHQGLAEHYRAEVLAAEERRDRTAATRALDALRLHDRGEHRDFLAGEGKLSLRTRPYGVLVEVARFETIDRREVTGAFRILGRTPLDAVKLEAGSYRLRLGAPGHATVDHLVHVPRGSHWRAIAPRSDDQAPLALPAAEAIGANEVYMAGDWARLGGDDEAPEGLPAMRAWIPSFAMSRYPVTLGEYVAFLQHLVRQGDHEVYASHLPRRGGTNAADALPMVDVDEDGYRILGDPALGPLTERSPVTGISQVDAWAYAYWLRERDGRPWRLPMEAEWEKAARGADRRPYVWGRRFEVTWSNVAGAREVPSLEAVDVLRRDVSPYGVVGLSGNAREWCADPFSRHGSVEDGGELVPVAGPTGLFEPHSIRGSTFFTRASPARICARFAAYPSERTHSVGFRLVYSCPP